MTVRCDHVLLLGCFAHPHRRSPPAFLELKLMSDLASKLSKAPNPEAVGGPQFLPELEVSSASGATPVLVRKCYEKLFTETLDQEFPEDGIRFAAHISGTPGIGKSFFFYYILYRFLQARGIGRLTGSQRRRWTCLVYIASADGIAIRVKDDDDGGCSVEPVDAQAYSSEQTLFVYDIPGRDRPPIFPEVTHSFITLASPRRRGDYGDHNKGTHCFYMPTWEQDEVNLLLEKRGFTCRVTEFGHGPLSSNTSVIDQLWYFYGGIPRALLDKQATTEAQGHVEEPFESSSSLTINPARRDLANAKEAAAGLWNILEQRQATNITSFLTDRNADVCFAAFHVDECGCLYLGSRYFATVAGMPSTRISIQVLVHIARLLSCDKVAGENFELAVHNLLSRCHEEHSFLLQPLNDAARNYVQMHGSQQLQVLDVDVFEFGDVSKLVFPENGPFYLRPKNCNFPCIDAVSTEGLIQITKGRRHNIPSLDNKVFKTLLSSIRRHNASQSDLSSKIPVRIVFVKPCRIQLDLPAEQCSLPLFSLDLPEFLQ